jgi:hypothetical protein
MTGTVIHSSYVRGSLVGKGTQFPVDESVSGCAGSVSLARRAWEASGAVVIMRSSSGSAMTRTRTEVQTKWEPDRVGFSKRNLPCSQCASPGLRPMR